jgi:hypothetical protein
MDSSSEEEFLETKIEVEGFGLVLREENPHSKHIGRSHLG